MTAKADQIVANADIVHPGLIGLLQDETPAQHVALGHRLGRRPSPALDRRQPTAGTAGGRGIQRAFLDCRFAKERSMKRYQNINVAQSMRSLFCAPTMPK